MALERQGGDIKCVEVFITLADFDVRWGAFEQYYMLSRHNSRSCTIRQASSTATNIDELSNVCIVYRT